jgi:S1-C subfamily serine protease
MGIVSGLGRDVQGYTIVGGRRTSVIYYDLIQTTAPVNPGDSGGLLVDSKGRMIGMISSSFGRSPSIQRIREMIREFARRIDLDQVQMFLDALSLTEEQQAVAKLVMDRLREFQKKVRESDEERPVSYEGMPEGVPGASQSAQGINFALPTDQVLFTARMIRAHGRVVRVGVKVSVPDPLIYAHLELEPGQGLDVRGVLPETPAARAGVSERDILLRFNGFELGHPRDFRRALVRSPVTGPVEVVVFRAGKRLTLLLRFD